MLAARPLPPTSHPPREALLRLGRFEEAVGDCTEAPPDWGLGGLELPYTFGSLLIIIMKIMILTLMNRTRILEPKSQVESFRVASFDEFRVGWFQCLQLHVEAFGIQG